MALAFVLAAALVATGCGPSTGRVSGKVTYGAATLKGGTVQFFDKAGANLLGSSEIKEDGTYSVDKVAPGDTKVVVETKSFMPPANVPSYKPPPGAPGGYTPPDPTEKAKRYMAIPDTYGSPQATPLTYTVKGGSQTYDIPLK